MAPTEHPVRSRSQFFARVRQRQSFQQKSEIRNRLVDQEQETEADREYLRRIYGKALPPEVLTDRELLRDLGLADLFMEDTR